MPEKVNILDIEFDNITLPEAVDLIFEAINLRDKKLISFINAHCLNISCSDKEYKAILQENEHIFPDGSGVNIACKLLGTPVKDNVNGTDMLPLLCEKALIDKKSFFLLGSKPCVAQEMKTKLEQQFPGINIAGFQHGYFSESENSKVIENINETNTDILLVGMGTPIQEKWIKSNAHKLDTKMIIGVGGLFDFYSGRNPRAPLALRKRGLEWCYRLYLEPLRLFRRYVIGNPMFLLRILKWKFLGKKYKTGR